MDLGLTKLLKKSLVKFFVPHSRCTNGSYAKRNCKAKTVGVCTTFSLLQL